MRSSRRWARPSQALKPTALIGVSGMPQTFTQPIVEQMAALQPAADRVRAVESDVQGRVHRGTGYAWSDGRAIFASGSPFPEVEFKGRRHVPGPGQQHLHLPRRRPGRARQRIARGHRRDVPRGGAHARGHGRSGRPRPRTCLSRADADSRGLAAHRRGRRGRGPRHRPRPGRAARRPRWRTSASRMFEPVYREYVCVGQPGRTVPGCAAEPVGWQVE